LTDVLVIGGGVIGLCTAWYAAERGHRVTVIDRRPEKHEGCSYGNAGMLTPSHFVPLSAPGVVRTALRWMFDAESPFYVRPRLDADLIRWGWKFNRAATAEHVAKASPVIRDLNLAGVAEYQELSRAWHDEFRLIERGIVMLCGTEHGLGEETHTAALANRLGVPAEVLSASAVEKLEPAIRMKTTGGVFYPRDAIISPGLFMRALLRRLAERGVDVRWETEVTGWRTKGDRVEAVRTSRGDLEAKEIVVCGGSWSPSLVRQLRLELPMQAGKGYSLTLPRPRQQPSRGIILTEARVAVTPMGESLRFGGTMEMAGVDESVNPSRIRGIVKSACRYFPEFTPDDFRGIEPWCGLRPCSPDGLPYIGRFRRYENLSVATGHAMMGLSLGPITGKLIGQVLAGEPASIDLAMLSPDRYSAV
jgi:D-amino-acid dehydrogenase